MRDSCPVIFIASQCVATLTSLAELRVNSLGLIYINVENFSNIYVVVSSGNLSSR